ncbi:Pan1 protein [Candida orthopsilosis Co 90-125]|uniref:Actin cytoskeleton-regulatory complex protein PAN1 n=1 Tax=Candida orthopsilosis (strain 90-125) TaxID=1136231 RepID=H8WXK2_CANO9|nr:Pan1 protein [Candida orthopsilosis Co 90-125]CCG21508.1 Pan1 protein [Candida orthopsilosis Co 90-125]
MFNSFQNTGYNPNYGLPNQQQQQQPLYTQPTGFAQPNLYASSQPTGYVQTQPTGFQGAPTVVENHDLKIPPFRLSFITVDDQKKFEHLFRTAVPRGEQAISGDSASTILMRSGLSPVTLAEIWTLSDVDKTGSLLFPEFALSLHLCNMAKRGEPLPGLLPEKWLNEVKSFMDAINFSIPDDPNKILANTPFAKKDDWMYNQPPVNTQATGFNQPPTSFAPQATGYGQSANAFAPQATGFNQQPQATSFNQQPQNNWIAPQITGYNQQSQPSTTFGGGAPGEFVPLKPQQTAGLVQKTGPLQAQGTGFNQLSQQRTGGLVPQTTGGLAPQTTGFQQQNQTGGMTSFNQQPTGGFNTIGLQPQRTGPLQANRTGPVPLPSQPTGPLQQQPTGALQPQSTGFLQQQPTGYLQTQPTGRPGEWGFVNMPIGGYSGLNTMHKVFQPNTTQNYQDLNKAMNNNAASNVTWAITKQEKQIYDNLFQAWDTGRKGYVDSSVALNVFTKSGLSRSDLETIWTLADTDDAGKLNKNQFAVAMHLIYRRLNGLEIPLRLPPELIPPADRTFRDTMDNLKNSLKNNGGIKSAKNYKPQTKVDGARFKNDDDIVGYVSRARHKSRDSASPALSNKKDSDLTIDQLKKSIKEKKILLDALDVEDEEKQRNDTSVIDKLKSQIFDLQTKITTQAPNNNKNVLLQRLNQLTRDKIPKLISNINKVNQEISEKSIELAKLKLKQEDPSWDDKSVDLNSIANDKGKVDLKQKMALLTGKGGSGGADYKFKDAVQKSKADLKGQSDMVKDIETGIKTMDDECVSKLKSSARVEVGYEKWEKGFGISQTVASFVRELQRYQDNATAKATAVSAPQVNSFGTRSQPEQVSVQKDSVKTPSAAPVANYSTPEERAAYIKAEAEKRMAARLEKLGISRNKNHGRKSTEKSAPSAVQSQQNHEQKASTQEKVKNNNVSPLVKQKTGVPEVPHVNDSSQPTAQKVVEKPRESFIQSPQPSPPAQPEPPKVAIPSQPASNESEKTPLNAESVIKSQVPVTQSFNESLNTPEGPEINKDNTATSQSGFDKTAQESLKPKQEAAVEISKNAAGRSDEKYKETEVKPQAVALPEARTQTEQPKPPRHDNNPFFKKQFQQVNTEKANMQRNFQRGISNDNSWSDSEEEDSDDDTPNRADALKLANSLFGGMAPSSTPTSESLNAPNQESKLNDVSEPQAEPEPVTTIPVSNTENLEDSSTGSSGPGWNTAESSPSSQPFTGDRETESIPPLPSDDSISPPPPSGSISQIPPPPPPAESIPPVPLFEAYGAQQSNDATSSAPPLPAEVAPPLPSSGSIPPPSPAPPAPPAPAPPAPPAPTFGAPEAPPPPPPPATAPNAPVGVEAPSTPDVGALLSQITGGKSLRKVETKESSGATVGRVL